MTWDPDKHTLTFSSLEEAETFHVEMSALLRNAMVNATRHIEDAAKAKDLSRLVMQDYAAVMRALNAMRSGLPRKGS